MWRSLARIRLWRANPAIGYSIAVVAVLISIGLRFLIEPHVTAGLPFITFFPAIILTTFLGGLGPGIAVAFIAGFVSWYFFLPPEFSFELGEKEFASLVVFWLIAAMDVTLVHLLNRALDHAHRLAGERAVLLDEIQHRVANHLQFLAALFQMQQRDADDPAVREAWARRCDGSRLSVKSTAGSAMHNASGWIWRLRFWASAATSSMRRPARSSSKSRSSR